jgi:hypothetical protein
VIVIPLAALDAPAIGCWQMWAQQPLWPIMLVVLFGFVLVRAQVLLRA